MTHLIRTTTGFLAIAALSGLLSCKSSSDAAGEADAGSGGDAGAQPQASDAGQAGQDQAGQGQAGDVAAAGATTSGGSAGAEATRGLIYVSQATVHSEALMLDSASSGLYVSFGTLAEAMRAQAATVVTTEGDCTASVLAIDPSAPHVTQASGLNAGAITVTGIGVPSSFVADFVDSGNTNPSNYGQVNAKTRFFEDGDVLSVQGAGGPDLPAFASQTLAAPSDIALTAPSCVTGTCPDVDHSQDLPFEWENGGAGKVDVLFETVAATKVVLLECKFDAQAGKGIVPASLLAKLDVVDADNVSGIEQISPLDEKTFLVGNVLTTFQIRTAQFEVLLQPAN